MEGSGKAQAEIYDDNVKYRGRRKLKRPSLATSVFIAATIALALISISLYGLAEHRQDSANRSLNWQVDSLCESIGFAETSLLYSVEENVSVGVRYGSALTAQILLEGAGDLVYSIRVMFSEDSKESEAFGAVSGALGTVRISAERMASDYNDAVTRNITYEYNSTIVSAISNITDVMEELRTLIWDGLDIDDLPYSDYGSTVKNMDLEAIVDVSDQLWRISRDLNGML